MQRPLKPFATLEEQLDKLQERGMDVESRDSALEALRTINYYRFTGYAFHFRKAKGDKYSKGCTFDCVLKIYEFDQKLRTLIFSMLEHIEVYTRTQIAYCFTGKNGPGAHYEVQFFQNKHYHDEFLKKLGQQIDQNANSAFVYHHLLHYGGQMPLWCAVEILSFSTLSKLYNNMLPADQDTIANSLGVGKRKYLQNWLHCFSVLRNLCAHYGRLYNVYLSPQISLYPKTLRRYPSIYGGSLLAYFIAMFRYFPDEGKRSRFVSDLSSLMRGYSDCVQLGLLGLPDDWLDILLDSSL